MNYNEQIAFNNRIITVLRKRAVEYIASQPESHDEEVNKYYEDGFITPYEYYDYYAHRVSFEDLEIRVIERQDNFEDWIDDGYTFVVDNWADLDDSYKDYFTSGTERWNVYRDLWWEGYIEYEEWRSECYRYIKNIGNCRKNIYHNQEG